VDQFAAAAASAAGWTTGTLSAVYDPTEQGGLAKLNSPDAVLAFVPYPFYVEHGTQLHLSPLAQADVSGIGTTEKWTLVAKNGRVTGPDSLAGYTIASVAGYAPEFVRHSALSVWELPPNIKIEPVGQILSVLRRTASGEPVVALLDQTQATALPTLPFAAELKAVLQSSDVPVAIVAVVNGRLPAVRAKAFQAGLLKLGKGGGGAAADALASLKLQGFVLPQVPAGSGGAKASAAGAPAGPGNVKASGNAKPSRDAKASADAPRP
jgi:hypothetical protein